MEKNLGGHTEEESGRDPIIGEARNYLEDSKENLSIPQQNILRLEEKYKDIPVPTQFEIKDTHGGWGVYIIKDNKVQDYKPEIKKIIDTFYYHFEPEIKNSINDEQTQSLLEEAINTRKAFVMDAILEEIHNSQIDKLVAEYNNGKDKYNCSPIQTIDINRGEKTYMGHIFKPILDLKIIARVSGGGDINSIHISKDVFSPRNGMEDKGNYLATLMGYKTSEDLVISLQQEKIGLN